jgi:hypothetical protein
MGTGVPDAPVRRLRGVAVLLVELHAHINVGHAAKDLIFLAHVLQLQQESRDTDHAFKISAVVMDDAAIATGNITHQQAWQYRYQSVAALLAGMQPSVPIMVLQQGATYQPEFGNETWWGEARSVCFDVGLQKAMRYAGDVNSALLLRQRMYDSCGVSHSDNAYIVLIVVHGLSSIEKDTRRWYDLNSLVKMVSESSFRTTWCGRPPCRALQVMVKQMKDLSVCGQVALYAKSKVVIVHHGASLANGLWLRASSVMVELNKQWSADHRGRMQWSPALFNAGYGHMFASTGIAYVGARVTYGVWPAGRSNNGRPGSDGRVLWTDRLPHYDFNHPDMEIGVNESRFALVLGVVNDIISLSRS